MKADVRVARRARSERLDRSCAALGVQAWTWLAGEGRWLDVAGSRRSLANEASAVLSTAVMQAIEVEQPSLILTAGRDGLTGHPDHIAIHRAVRQGAAAASLPLLGAALSRDDVAAGYQLLRRHGFEAVGSGRVRGSDNRRSQISLDCGDSAGRKRQVALDSYGQGLGTTPLELLAEQYSHRGDSLVVRAALEHRGWGVDRFEVIEPTGSTRLVPARGAG